MTGSILDSKHKASSSAGSSDSHSLLSSILESTMDAVVSVTSTGGVSYANGKALRSFPSLRIGDSYFKCLPWLLDTLSEKYQHNAMDSRQEVKHEALYPPSERWYKITINPMKEGFSVFFSDITEEKASESESGVEQLLREKRIEALSYMAGGLAHEISNPLTIIQGWAHDLEEMAAATAALPAQEVAAVCDKILKTTVRASNIVRGLKAFGRDGSHDPMEPASIYVILDQSVELLETRFARNHVEVRIDVEPAIPRFLCREVQIGQILTNLLNNACDAIVQSESEERWISVKARSFASEILVEVSDSGPGVDEQQKKHLMKPFFTTKEFGTGMGIGLSLSRAIAQSHGGTLTLLQESSPTCFRLSLPFLPSSPEQDSVPQLSEVLHEVEQG